MLHPDFRWKSHTTPWGTERWLYVGDLAVGVVDELQGTCYLSYRSNLESGSWISARTETLAGGVATVERWASAHARELRLLGTRVVPAARETRVT